MISRIPILLGALGALGQLAYAQPAAPSLSVSSGTYTLQQSVTVTGPAGATLAYTLDGSDPDATSSALTSGSQITFSGRTTLKVKAFQGASSSPTATGTYYITGAVAAGQNHAVQLRADGTVWTWGENADGQLGDGTLAPTSSRRLSRVIDTNNQILTGIKAVASSANYTAALKEDGTVWAWGGGSAYNKAAQVQGLTNVKAIEARTPYGTPRAGLALKTDGTLWTWTNSQGGANSFLSSITAIASRSGHSLALTTTGQIWAWGNNDLGQLGAGDNAQSTWVRQVLIEDWQPNSSVPLSGIVSIAVGEQHSVAVRNDGSVFAWGSNLAGALGTTQNPLPTNGTGFATRARRVYEYSLSYPITTAVSAEAGYAYTAVILNDGSVVNWSAHNVGRLGPPFYPSGTGPVWPVYPITSSYPSSTSQYGHAVSLASGGSFTLALERDGAIVGWGVPSPTVSRILHDGSGSSLDDNYWGALPEVVSPTRRSGASVGGEHTLTLQANGTVSTFGRNDKGQLGVGTTEAGQTAQLVKTSTGAPFSGVVSVAAGGSHSLAAKSDGTVWSWGDNLHGQLGNGENGFYNEGDIITAQQNLPIQVSSLSNVIAVSANSNLSLALKRDGTVWSWGGNWNGELGNGTTTDSNVPVQVNGLSNVIKISAGGGYVTALKRDGTVWVWGSNSVGQLGIGSTAANVLSPVVVPGLDSIRQISSGGGQTLAVRGDLQLYAWGANSYGQLGDGTTTNRISPVLVNLANYNSYYGSNAPAILEVAAGGSHSLFLNASGDTYAWGSNASGQLGKNRFDRDSSNVVANRIPEYVLLWGAGRVNAIAAGWEASLVVADFGTVHTWGKNRAGQLGHPLPAERTRPVQLTNRYFAQISASSGHALGIDEYEGRLYIWGNNNYYNTLGIDGLPDVTTYQQPSTSQPVDLGLTGFSAVAAGYNHSLALHSDGTIWEWGSVTGNYNSVAAPTQLTGISGAVAIGAGFSHSVVAKADGTVWSWGENRVGELGNGTFTGTLTPVQATITSGAALTGITSVKGGNMYSIALKNDGTVWTWGSGSYGKHGNGQYSNRDRAAQVSSLTNIVAIESGPQTQHVLALDGTGRVWAWGLNTEKQVGHATASSRTSPYLIPAFATGTPVTAIAAGSSHSLALKADGTVWAWGTLLANGAQVTTATPVQITRLGSVTAIAAGYESSFAIVSGETPQTYAWGKNWGGTLGVSGGLLGTATPTLVPDLNVAGSPGTVKTAGPADGTAVSLPYSLPLQVTLPFGRETLEYPYAGWGGNVLFDGSLLDYSYNAVDPGSQSAYLESVPFSGTYSVGAEIWGSGGFIARPKKTVTLNITE